MMNPNIVPAAGATAPYFLDKTQSVPTGLTGAITDIADGYNNYTFAQLAFSNSTGVISRVVPSSTADNYWALHSLTVNLGSSLYADASLLDFYIATVEGTTGPLNRQNQVSYVLINGFTLDTSLYTSINVAISNFWVGTAAVATELGTSMLPALFKIEGTITSSPKAVTRLALFFDSTTPLFNNFYSQSAACSSSESSNIASCRAMLNSYSSLKNV
jgi:hypothetical protein